MAQFMTESDGLNMQQDAADIALCKAVWEELEKYYPGHPWMVGADHFAGVVTIQLAYEDGKDWNFSKYGHVLHINKLITPEEFKKVRNAGGDMLERFKLFRGRAAKDAEIQARHNGIIKDGALL